MVRCHRSLVRSALYVAMWMGAGQQTQHATSETEVKEGCFAAPDKPCMVREDIAFLRHVFSFQSYTLLHETLRDNS
jgi:hypothetical protein